jgi:hypothetical protein
MAGSIRVRKGPDILLDVEICIPNVQVQKYANIKWKDESNSSPNPNLEFKNISLNYESQSSTLRKSVMGK